MSSYIPTLPVVTYIIPTFNAEKYLRQCLNSIFIQDYPRDRYEVLVADGGSSDKTRDIVSEYGVTLIENPKRIAEFGKYLAYKQAKGSVLCLLDSDNVIVSSVWLSKMVVPLMEESDLIGVESNYLIAHDFSSINTYANLLIIIDPLARMLASKPVIIEKKQGYIVKRFSKGSTPVSGANGFLWRKSIVKEHINDQAETLEEANLMAKIARSGSISYGNIPNVGIYHYYCATFSDYVKKRRKIAEKFLGRKERNENTWVDSKRGFSFLLKVLYLVSIVGPLIEGIGNAIRSRRTAWLWHPILSFVTISIYVLAVVRGKIQ